MLKNLVLQNLFHNYSTLFDNYTYKILLRKRISLGNHIIFGNITIETENDFVLLKGLAQRMGLSLEEGHSGKNETEQQAAFRKFAGSWQGEETGEELSAMIRNSRYDSPREIDL